MTQAPSTRGLAPSAPPWRDRQFRSKKYWETKARSRGASRGVSRTVPGAVLFVLSPLLLLLVGRVSHDSAMAEAKDVPQAEGENTGLRMPSLYSFDQRRRLQTGVPAGVLVSESSVSVSESGVDAAYTVVLDADPGTPLTVNLAPASAEVTATPSTLSFTSATWSDVQTITVAPADDDVVEGLTQVDITHTVDIADSNFMWTGTFTPSDTVATSVYDDDTAGVLLSVSALYIDENSFATYTIALMGGPSGNVLVTATADDAYLSISTSMPLTFTSGSWATPQTVTVNAVDDAVETAESYASTLSHAASSADNFFDGSAVLYFPVSEIAVTIYDNDDGCYRSCDPGYYASPCNGSFECSSCNPGYYCTGACTDPVACPAGTALTSYGGSLLTECTSCTDGYYSAEEGSGSCSLCSAGYECTSSSAVACAAGYYASAGATECSECPDGFYNALSAQESCQPCPAGHECSDKAADPLACSPGSYSLGNSTACTECPAGYYCSSTGDAPALCEDGSYSLTNWAYCVVCPAGHYCMNTNEVPTSCPAGTASLGGSTFCISCGSGTYAASNGSMTCSTCPAGSSCLDLAATPVLCENGTFSHMGDGYCTSCDAGTYSVEGSTGCLACPVGKSCFDPTTEPFACGEGYYSEGGTVLACSICSPGTYTTSSHDRCAACLGGYECSDPALGPTLCNDGFYSPNGSIVCTECQAGSFCTTPYTLPQSCDPGTYSTSGSGNCTICPGGYSCSTPSVLPLACEDGEYSPDGFSTCLVCPAGFYCPGPPFNEESMAACPPGQYSVGGASACSACPKGYYCPDASQAPEACPDGYYADIGNQTSCDRCPAGYYCPSAAMPEQACTDGYYSPEGKSNCTECPAGFACFSASSSPVACEPGTLAVAGSSNCTSCSPGYHCPSTDSAEQYECPLGTYSTGGASSCQGCSSGYYCPHTTVALELACPDGYFAVGGAQNCTACPAGTSCSSDGATMIACNPGYYSQAGALDCVPCPAGYYCPFTDQAIELECPTGHYSEGALADCVACAAGYYCPYKDSPEALPCLSGSYATGGMDTCTECPAGFTCSSTSTAQMEACGEGYYSLLGAPLCTACPAGSRCPLPSDSPITCDPGYYSSTAAVNCTSCPAGYFCDDPEASPQPCEVGYYSGGGAALCLECMPGYRCPEASVSATPAGSECPEGTYCNPPRTLTECPAGTYGNVTAAISEVNGCQTCTPGYYCSDTGNTLASRQICPAGYYCPVGSASPTGCAAGMYNTFTGSWSVDDCAACTPGFYCNRGSDSGESAICPAGHYCPASTPSDTAYPCPAGTYSGLTGLVDSTGCMNCTVGGYCPEGSIAPTDCAAGTYSPYMNAMSVAACLACEPGWACPSTGMYQMTTRCGTGAYCPAGTAYRREYLCDAGTWTDQTNLTLAAQCTICPERKACPIGSTSTDWTYCDPGYYCPEGTPAGDSFPCPAGYFTNRTDLASASECYPCPLGFFCGGGGSVEPDGPCATGYYCPLKTAAATDFPCPAGTFSNSTSLYLESQCEDCPPGYYCPEASTQIEPCPAGTYSPYNATEDAGPDEYPSCTTCPAGSYCVEASEDPVPCGVGLYSDDGADNCTVCAVGHYCGSNETSASAMITGGGSWENNADDAGQCYNGTYCPEGMNRAPDLARDSCPAGYYCPIAVTSPYSCPSGTFNPHGGMDEEDDCQISTAGYYTIEASINMTGKCSPGFYCPAGSTGPEQVACPDRYYRTDEGAASVDDCALCVAGGYCPSGSTEPLDCPRGYYCVTGIVNPEPCPLGTYGNSTGIRQISDCTDCTAGYYCDQRGLTQPADLCDPGYYCLDGSYTSAPSAPGAPLSADESDIGGLCPAGGYCPIGSSYPQPCPSGTYNNYSGASTPADCTVCPPGYYCSGTSNPAPTGACYSGYFCTGGAELPTQYFVEAGYYSDPGASQQYPCLPGTYNNEERQASCLDCLAGYYCPDYAGTQPDECPAGTYCPEGSDVATLCPAGTYSPTPSLTNVSQCTLCNPGKYCPTNGLTAVGGPCDAGYYCTSGAILNAPAGQSYGGPCTAGHYCPEGTPYPEPCPLGTYYGGLMNDGDVWYNDTITGDPFRTYCFLCSATHACNSTGLSTPDHLCGEGYFCKLGADSPTPYCQAGEGLCDYGVCPVGHYCPTGTADPIVCPAGTFMNNTGAGICFTCPAGFYCDGSSPTEFVECPAGRYCPLGTDATIPKCPEGTFSPQTGLTSAGECTDCTSGQYCDYLGLTSPNGTCSPRYFCPPGSKNSHGETDTETENICPVGRYCEEGVGTPDLCPSGTFNPTQGALALEDCLACTSGNYCENNGLSAPTGGCYEGYFCKRGVDEAMPTSGTYFESTVEYGGGLCPVGTYCPNGTHTPLPCEAGTYNDLEGQKECFECPAGFYCEANSTEFDSSPCPAGYYCPEGTRYAQEFPCPSGTFVNTTLTTSLSGCVDAPAGSYVVGSASTEVTGSCAQGFFCVGGSSSATPFCVETSGGECETGGPCEPGEYCPLGSPFPLACPGGSYCSDSSGQITGECYEGYYCTQGSWTPAPGNESDPFADGESIGGLCPQGHYCPTGSIAPRACSPGTYSPATGNTNSSACLPCEAGFLCPFANTTSPTEPCPAGYYCPSGTAEAYLQCDVGTACPESSWEPSDCDAGTYQPNTGQAACVECPQGYYCLSGASELPDCPTGSYCPAGTLWDTQFICPNGTFGNATNLVSAENCTTCSPGAYCFERGLSAPTGPCEEGFYCNAGAIVATPDSFSSVGYTGDTCVDRTNGTENDVCPTGHYCPEGSATPIPCPPGTTSSTFGLVSVTECPQCTRGYYCPDNGASNSTVPCLEGYYCPGGDALPTNECPTGTYCPAGSGSPVDCPAGTFQNDSGSSECNGCPARFYCENGASEALACPTGHYCLEGTEFGSQFPCRNGTFSNETGLATASDCSQCSPGRFCGTEGLTEPEGLCSPGYYCALGATSPVPAGDVDPSVGGLCAAGYACVQGAESPQPVDGVTGYACPRGTFCPEGSSAPLGCPPGTYNPSEGMGNCTECPAGSICEANSTTPVECPVYHFCPVGSFEGIPCPLGTHGARTDLQSVEECAPCPAGHYCIDGNITSTCRAGYFCKTGADTPTPNSEYSNYSYSYYDLVWEALDSGPCPAGHYCPVGTEDPVQCENATVRVALMGVSSDDCGVCPPGFVCFPGEAVPEQCYRGYYCPQGVDPIPCPLGTYNPFVEQDDQDDCNACPAGSYCDVEGVGNYSQYPCPAGHYCLMREDEPEVCPSGRYRNNTGAAVAEDCHICPGGSHCQTASTDPEACPSGTYCPEGASNTTACPAGYYCPVEAAEPTICPDGYYCPFRSAEPILCVLGTYCPEGSEIYTSCPLGWYGSTTSNNTLHSRDDACDECPRGMYGADPERLVCESCPAGYVCLGTTRTASPESVEGDGGYICPAGYYCPQGSWAEIPCEAGSHNPLTGSGDVSACVLCGADLYQDQEGSSTCLPCSSSSTSAEGSTECLCLGLNRAFQLSDGQCICRSGYEYYDEGGLLVSAVDGSVDCQPIVYDRCYTGEALDVDGDCLSESDCKTRCGDAGGEFFEHIGLCECYGLQDLNEVCDATCRDSAPVMFVDPSTGFVIIIDGNSTEYLDTGNMEGFAGALYCTSEAGCSLYPVAVGNNFTGIYGIGGAVTAASSTTTSSRRRRDRRLDRSRRQGFFEAGEDGYGDDNFVMLPTADTIERFLQNRAENYRPRNPYRNLFDGNGKTVAGAIPKGQRPSPRSAFSGIDAENLAVEGIAEWEEMEYDPVRRRLVDEDEPAVMHPLGCVEEGDSVLFDISSGCYPVYEKDSLLNSNTEFDYGEFRTVAELALSSATYETFAFVLEETGTYVFSSSCDPNAIFVLVVMPADVSCTTEAYFVPLTAANLILLGVSKNSDNITLTPDWALIGGLLAGVAFMILGVVSAVYYFRTKAWATGEAPIPTYRKRAQADHLDATEDDARQRPGFFVRRPNKISPGHQASSRPNSWRSKRGWGGRTTTDPEMPGSPDSMSYTGQDDPNVRELVDQLQQYHDVIEREFTGQKDLVLKLHHLLEQEADELKRLLGGRAGAIASQSGGSGVDEGATRGVLLRLKTEITSRRLHEAGTSASEVEALGALRRLQQLLREGAAPFAARAVAELAVPSGPDGQHATTSALLREITDEAELIRVEVVDELVVALDRERHREHNARMLLEGAVQAGGVALSEAIAHSLRTVSEKDALTDTAELGVTSTLRRLADRLPVCSQELKDSEALIARNFTRLREMGNTALEDTERERGEDAIRQVLEQLIEALAVVGAKADIEKKAADRSRVDAEVERNHLDRAIDESIATLDTEGMGQAGGSSVDLQGMLKEIRSLVTTSTAAAATVTPTATANAPFSQLTDQQGTAGDVASTDEDGVESRLRAAQDASMAKVAKAAEAQKRKIRSELEQSGATQEETKALMQAVAQDQRLIEGLLEAERIRVEDNLKATAASRKARDERDAAEDAKGVAGSAPTKEDLLRQQAEQIEDLRRKHQEALGAVGTVPEDIDDDAEGAVDSEDEDETGAFAALKEVHAQQAALLEETMVSKAKNAQQALAERLRARRAKREAELIEKGASATDAAILADDDLAGSETSQREQLASTLANERLNASKKQAAAQRKAIATAAAAKDPAAAAAAVEAELHRMRKQATEALEALETALGDQAKTRRKALSERLEARRRGREAELKKHGAGEAELRDADADLTQLEELESEVLEESLHAEREAALKEPRARAAAAEAATVTARRSAAGAEKDLAATITAKQMRDLHLLAMSKLEKDLNKKDKCASRALRERLLATRSERQARIQEKESLPASQAARKARKELGDEEKKERLAMVEQQAVARREALERARTDAEEATEANRSLREETDRLLSEHRSRSLELQQALKADADGQRASLEKRLASRRKAAKAALAESGPLSPAAAAASAARADEADQAERAALEMELKNEISRTEKDNAAYEKSVQKVLAANQEEAAKAKAATGEETAAEWAAEEAKARQEELRSVHEREVAALEMQNHTKRRGAAERLAQRRAVARAAHAEAMRAAGKDEQEVAKTIAEDEASEKEEAAALESSLQAAGEAVVEEERARQLLAVAADADPKKEAARIRERHSHYLDVLEKELEQHRRDQRQALSDRLRKRKEAKKKTLQQDGAGKEEFAPAMRAVDADSDRDAIELEEALHALENTQRAMAMKAYSFAAGEEDCPEEGLAALRAQHQESELRLKESLRAEATARKARLSQRIAVRVATSTKELEEAGRNAQAIAADAATIRAAGKAEEKLLDAIIMADAEGRVLVARQNALADEGVMETRRDATMELRESHEKAFMELLKSLEEMKRSRREALATSLKERREKKAAELKASKAKKQEVTAELELFDKEAEEEQQELEETLEEEADAQIEAERIMLAKREVEARAAQLTADNSKRAAQTEVERLRREHEGQQRSLEDTLEAERITCQRSLSEKLAQKRKARMATADTAASRAQVDEELDKERHDARRALEERLNREMCAALEEKTNKLARAEAAARAAAQKAIDEAEERARIAREVHERNTKILDEQLAEAKVIQGKRLRSKLAKKRKEREEQLKRENAEESVVEAARAKLAADDARETAALENHILKEKVRLLAENRARGAAKRAKEEAKARDEAAAAAAAQAAAEKEAEETVRKLQLQHAEQLAALDLQLHDERKSREAKLRDRLAKKRLAKEAEMQAQALTETEMKRELKRLEETERVERQHLLEEAEEEKMQRIVAQRKMQEDALMTATRAASAAAESAAAAAARAAAADAVREAVDAAEKDEFKHKAMKLKEASQAEQERAKVAIAGQNAEKKIKLVERLAKRKAKAEAAKRDLELLHKEEEERLKEKHKAEAEAAAAAAAPGWTGDIAWDKAVDAAMSEPSREGEGQRDREARVLKSVLEAGIVPDNKIGKCVEAVMSIRHHTETCNLLEKQYKERAAKLASSLGSLLEEKNRARADALRRLPANSGAKERAEATTEVEDDFAGRQQQLEMQVIQEMEPVHLEKQLELRQKQLLEVAGTVKTIAPENALQRLQEIAAERQKEELEEYRKAMEREKAERLKRVKEERANFEEDLHKRHKQEMRRLQEEDEKVIAAEKEAQEARMNEKKEELERQRVEAQRRLEERSGQLDTKEKEALLEQFKKDQAAGLGALKAEGASQKSKLEQKLAARRQKKAEELKKKEALAVKEKEKTDKLAIQKLEKQAQIATKAEAAALAASQATGLKGRDASGLNVEIDQHAVQLARKASLMGMPNEAKEMLKKTLAESESRNRLHASMRQHLHGSISSQGGTGGAAAAAAASAAAAAATSAAYTHIHAKLEGIEDLIAALKAAQNDRKVPGQQQVAGAGATSGAGVAEVYRDAEDAATVPEGDDLQIVPRDSLPVQALARLEFGEHLIAVLGLGDTVALQVAKNLPRKLLARASGGSGGASAFRNSYLWDAKASVLYLHVRRLSSSGDFGLVLVHAAAHISVDPKDMSNDLDPRFTHHFHRSLKVLTQELFKYRGAAPSGDGGLTSAWSHPESSRIGLLSARMPVMPVGSGNRGEPGHFALKMRGSGTSEYAQAALAERLERYAKASGHPRLMELLSRHAKDQKDKFTLSDDDDEDEVSNADDAAYMEHYDRKDGDSIVRSPIGSGSFSRVGSMGSGGQSPRGDNEKEEKEG